ncbi:MAG: hybrid sensor histidine kinase/response regulator [Verrucomicrobiaceae bacterium]|nr:MAG: hybrid sensor histidine kinase/response regulator [Verrucomicrobiaceae bacterium]
MRPETDTSRNLRWPFSFIGICGALCAALGMMVMAGWHAEGIPLVRIRPGPMPMPYLTAVCFLLSGTGLLCLAFRFHRVLTAACGWAVAGCGILVLLEPLLRAESGSGLLISSFPAIPGMPSDRSASPAAAAFALCGLNLLLLALPVPAVLRRICTWILSTPVPALALVALCGDAAALTGMSPPTLAGLFILGIALLATQFMDPVRLIGDRWPAVPGFRRFRGRNSKIWMANQQLRKAQQELREMLREKKAAQALLEAAGRMARLGHWELPAGTGDPQWSAVMYEIHDLPPDTPISRTTVERFVHPADREALRQRARKAFQTGEAYEMEVRLITEKGRQIWVQMRGEPRRGEDGEIVAIHGIVQDIDERHRGAELLREQNRQLAIATARAEAHARAKAEFLANMSHEIRTPLNAVIGMSELLMHGRLEARERGFVETIHSSGDMLLSLINDILDFSKIESGQLELEHIPVSVRDMAESVMDLLAGAAAAKKLELICWTDPAVPQAVLGDPTRLRQVLMNLVGNAIKFTTRGEVFLKVSVREHGGASWLHAAVRDTGIGISAEGRERLFAVFSQVDASTTRRFGGTGLGLAISQRIIRTMGGDIQVESEVGKGSTFQFEIPLRPVESPAPPETVGNDAQAARHLKDMRVLIVDDNAASRWVLQAQCASWSMQPTVAEGAREALALTAAGEKYHLAIIDGLMPDMDGYELMARIREERNAQELPILILTSMDDPGRDWKSLEIPAVLAKPVRAAALLGAVRDILRPAPGAVARRPAAPPPVETPGIPGSLRILVAEDNPVNQRVVALHLQRMGCPHTMVANGAEALDAVARTRFDVILMDVQMPVMDGLEAARELCRLYPADQRPWIIALTANAQGSDRDECLEAGMNDYLSKPVRGESLRQALCRAFERTLNSNEAPQ